jgi:hypothetical protein
VQLPLKAALAVIAAAAVTACQDNSVKAPTEKGACWHVVSQGEGRPLKFNRLPGHYAQMEFCAGGLELIRRRGTRSTITGAYQGTFIFVERRGLFWGKTLNGARYLALVRTDDGRLAIPGAERAPPPPGMSTGT